MEKHYSLLSPIQCLPAELLLHIFQFIPTGSDPRDISRSPWILGHICSYWRAISVNCPALWTFLKAEEHHVEHSSFQPVVKEFLKQSANLPLHVSMKANSVAHRLTHPDCYAVFLQELCRHSHQWQTIRLPIPTPASSEQLRNIRGRLPLLRGMALKIHSTHDLPCHMTIPIDAFLLAPQLVQVKLDTDAPGHVALPMSQLEVFHICQVSWKDLHSILNWCSGMITLTIFCHPPRTTLTLPIITHS